MDEQQNDPGLSFSPGKASRSLLEQFWGEFLESLSYVAL